MLKGTTTDVPRVVVKAIASVAEAVASTTHMTTTTTTTSTKTTDQDSESVSQAHQSSTTAKSTTSKELSSIEDAVAAFSRGAMVIVVDDPARENEGDLIVAASLITPSQMAFIIRHTSGIVCIPMRPADCDRLGLPDMVPYQSAQHTEPHGTRFTISVDAAPQFGVTTGISAADRVATARKLAATDSQPAHFVRPGHVFPLRAAHGGVLVRPGHTEASVDLCALAGVPRAAVISELMRDDGTVMRMPEISVFARAHGIPLFTVQQIRTLVARRSSGDPDAWAKIISE